jgi:hypothetical protein
MASISASALGHLLAPAWLAAAAQAMLCAALIPADFARSAPLPVAGQVDSLHILQVIALELDSARCELVLDIVGPPLPGHGDLG